MKPRANGRGFSPCDGCLAPSRCEDCAFSAAVEDGFALRAELSRVLGTIVGMRARLEKYECEVPPCPRG
jgi:hypothetical protein